MQRLLLPFALHRDQSALRQIVQLARGPLSRWRAALRMWQQSGLLVSDVSPREIGRALLLLANRDRTQSGPTRERLGRLARDLLDGALPTATPATLSCQDAQPIQPSAMRLFEWEDHTADLTPGAIVAPPWRRTIEEILAPAARRAVGAEIVDRYAVQRDKATRNALEEFLRFAKREHIQSVAIYCRLRDADDTDSHTRQPSQPQDRTFQSADQALEWVAQCIRIASVQPRVRLRVIGAPRSSFDRHAHDRFLAFRRTNKNCDARVFQLGTGLAAWGRQGQKEYPVAVCQVSAAAYESEVRHRLEQEGKVAGPLEL